MRERGQGQARRDGRVVRSQGERKKTRRMPSTTTLRGATGPVSIKFSSCRARVRCATWSHRRDSSRKERAKRVTCSLEERWTHLLELGFELLGLCGAPGALRLRNTLVELVEVRNRRSAAQRGKRERENEEGGEPEVLFSLSLPLSLSLSLLCSRSLSLRMVLTVCALSVFRSCPARPPAGRGAQARRRSPAQRRRGQSSSCAPLDVSGNGEGQLKRRPGALWFWKGAVSMRSDERRVQEQSWEIRRGREPRTDLGSSVAVQPQTAHCRASRTFSERSILAL